MNNNLTYGVYPVSEKADNNPRHYIYIPGFLVQEMLNRNSNKEEREELKEQAESVMWPKDNPNLENKEEEK